MEQDIQRLKDWYAKCEYSETDSAEDSIAKFDMQALIYQNQEVPLLEKYFPKEELKKQMTRRATEFLQFYRQKLNQEAVKDKELRNAGFDLERRNEMTQIPLAVKRVEFCASRKKLYSWKDIRGYPLLIEKVVKMGLPKFIDEYGYWFQGL